MRFITSIIIYGLIGFVTVSWADDPFTPPEKVQLMQQILYDTKDTSLPRFKMFMVSDNKPKALLGETFVRQGDVMSGYVVESITSERVVLVNKHGEKKVIIIDSLQSDLDKLKK